MKLVELFKKPVDRPIDGVIKADDDQSLFLEVEEYVLTHEVEKRLDSFLDAYNHHTTANGVWISGFFGSGKSHLLKMLSLLLENKTIEGHQVLDSFLEKCQKNDILMGDLKKACQIPSESILFNIDQKADVISKKEVDALISVFVRVFDEHCGYYGKQSYVAQFERELDQEGLFDQFKAQFKELSGKIWEDGRKRVKRLASDIDQAYSQVTQTQTSGILDKYRSDYKLSIEDFAAQVNAYIDSKEKDFRLNFFVDEVGQYIAENTKLMVNLQTVAESLATKCHGRAWIIVTAQEDMSSVVGDTTTKTANDFTKIMARFANRMKLTSQDVTEVISKRLLTKEEHGLDILSDLYHKQSANFKTLFDFTDGSLTFKNFKDKDDFIHKYPFIPYQFDLFQLAIQGLSTHNAFEGAHSSVGERSMLGVFQDVAKKIKEHDVGQLASFDLMFEGIRTAVKSTTQSAIQMAEKNLGNEMAVKILKALYLVKYVKGFKPTTRNITILMLDRFDRQLSELKTEVEQALNLLLQQTYIQRNGDTYEYLTDEEKDIEQEIKSTDVEMADVLTELSNLIYNQVYKKNKVTYSGNHQDYPFARKLDDQNKGREYELSMNVISPFHENVANEELIKSHALSKPELTILMPADERLYYDLMMYKRTEKYVRHNQGNAQSPSVNRIISEKVSQNRIRHNELLERTKTLLGESKIIVSGEQMDMASGDAVNRIEKGFESLIAKVYPNLRMLQGVNYQEEQIAHILNESGETLFGNNATEMSEAELEVISTINQNHKVGIRTTLKTLLDKFEKKPYGWSVASVLCILSKLIARAKVEARQDSQVLEDQGLVSALRNQASHPNVILHPQVEFDAKVIKNLQRFIDEYFHTKTSSKEPKLLGKEVSEALKAHVQELREYYAQKSQYGFLSSLEGPIGELEKCVGKPYSYYLSDFLNMEDKLLDIKEDLIDPMVNFMKGGHKAIYDETIRFISENQPNFNEISEMKVQDLQDKINSPGIYKGQVLQTIKALRSEIEGEIDEKLTEVKSESQAIIREIENKIYGMEEYPQLDSSQQDKIQQKFKSAESDIDTQSIIAVVLRSVRKFEDEFYPQVLNQIETWNMPAPEPTPEPVSSGGGAVQPKVSPEPIVQQPLPTVAIRDIRVSSAKPTLDNESEVDQYLQLLKSQIMHEIDSGNRVRV